jgi:hypothetical protein
MESGNGNIVVAVMVIGKVAGLPEALGRVLGEVHNRSSWNGWFGLRWPTNQQQSRKAD